MKKDLKNKLKFLHKEIKHTKLIGCDNLNELVGYLSGYELFLDNSNDLLGYCDYSNKIIMINPKEETFLQMVTTTCHEIGHAFQAQTGHFDNFDGLLSSRIKEEREAENIGLYLFRLIYPNIINPEKYFSIPYKDLYSIMRLKDYYGKWVEDDLSIVWVDGELKTLLPKKELKKLLL